MARITETREQVVETLNALRECKVNIIKGEAASYTIGTRQVTFLRLDEVNQAIREYEQKLDILDGYATIRGGRTVVPIDS